MAGLGLLNWQSNADIDADEAKKQAVSDEAKRQQAVEFGITQQITHDWERAKQAKRRVEARLLDCLRRYNGEYSPSKLAQIKQEGGSEIYMQITSTKCRAAASWIRDVLLSAMEKSWGLDPTPVSEIPPHIKAAIEAQVVGELQQRAAAGEQIDVDAAMNEAMEDVKKRANQAARKACDNMELLIEDQFAEGGYNDAIEEFIDDFSIFCSAIIKGPVLERRNKLAWADGWKPIKDEEIIPTYHRISPFDFYPSPEATDCDTAAYLIERVRFTRKTINSLRGTPGYRDDMIDGVLRDHGIGGLKDWLYTDAERQHLEGRDDLLRSDSGTIDGLIYTGSCIGLKLLQWGSDPEMIEPLKEYDIEATLIGRYLIRVIITNDPLDRRKYSHASFQNIPGAFWGRAVPELMPDIQDHCNATARAMQNNMALASGPMVEVNYDRLLPGEEPDIFPWKTWQTKSSQRGSNDPAIRFYQPNSNASELMAVYNDYERKSDDSTGIPRYTYGNEKVGGAGDTFGGLSLLMDAASKNIKLAISHVDRVISRVVEAQWMHNMLYHPNNEVKGDCKIVARGSSAILMRERTNMLRAQFLQTTSNPTDLAIIGEEGRARLLAKSAEELDVPDLVPDVDELIKRKAQAAQQAQEAAAKMEALQTELMEADRDLKLAQAGKAAAETNSARVNDRETGAKTMKAAAEAAKIRDEIGKDNGDTSISKEPRAVEADSKPRRQLGLSGV